MLLDRHRAKIVTPERLAEILGPRPRQRTVVACGGVFDVVHPGHLRHLLYAKSKADVLVCLVTADRFTSKGPYRPHVPQDLRAQNLAVLDIVDYVVVTEAERPDDLLAELQPDFYAKGFEYAEENRGRPIGEVVVVEAYGGEVLFTPGDVTYSSTALIDAAAPDLRWDKLSLLMESAHLSFDDLRSVVRALPEQRVHVVGDMIVDALVQCEVIGASGKTPTLSVRREGREDFVGGAGVVALHARATGADVRLTTVLGNDAPGLFAHDRIMSAGIEVYSVVDRARPTTLKEVVVAEGYRLLKIDTVDSRSVSDQVLRRICREVSSTEGGAVIFSDFRHGIFNARTIPPLVESIPARCLCAADSQVASRWGNITEFRGFDLATPNEREARFALGDQDSGVRALGARLRQESGCEWLLMKLGPRGALGFGLPGGAGDGSFSLDSFVRAARDPVGAGGALLAWATLSLLARPGNFPLAAILGVLAASCECEYDGNVPVDPDAVLGKIDEAEREVGT